MPSVKLYLLGSPRIELDGMEVTLGLKKGLALLAFLAVTRKPHSRDALAALLWPESDQSTARAALRRTLYLLNKALSQGELLKVTPETVLLNQEANFWLDTEQYHHHIVACRRDSAAASPPNRDCLHNLDEAASLYGSDFMAGFNLPDCPEFDEWQFFQSESLRQSLSEVLERLVEAHKARADYMKAISYCRRWLTIDTFREEIHRQLMELYALSGQNSAALRQYDRCVQMLKQEFGKEPTQDTIDLYNAVRSGIPIQEKAKHFDIPKTHFVKSGAVHVAYQVVGEGPVDVIFVSGFVSHLEHIWKEPRLSAFLRSLSSFCRLILFDKRGVGLSDRIGHAPTLDHTVDDILTVMSAAQSERAVLVGICEGGPAVSLFAAVYPERTLGIILYGAMAKGSRSLDYPWASTEEQFNLWLDKLVKGWGGPAGIEYFAPNAAGEHLVREWWAELLRLGSSPGAVKAVLDVYRDIDVRNILPAIRVPALILHRKSDRVIMAGGARFMAVQIPGAHYVELTGRDHWFWMGETGPMLETIRDFMTSLDMIRERSTALLTLMFAETAMSGRQSSLGSKLPQEFKIALDSELRKCRGREIRRSDNRVLFAFYGPGHAVQYAVAFTALAAKHAFPVRIGLHTGECTLVGDRLEGAAVQVAAAVMEKASVHEVWVTGTLKDLLPGNGFAFESRAAVQLRGASGKWPLFRLINTLDVRA